MLFSTTDNSTVLTKQLTAVEGANSDILVFDGRQTDFVGFDTTPASISIGGVQTATTIENVDLQDFGAEIRMIGSGKCVWQPATGRRWCWSNCIRYWTESAYIGNGKEVTNDPELLDSV